MGHSKSNSEREVHSATGLAQEARKISNIQSNPTSKELEKQQYPKPRVSRIKEIIKMTAVINDIKTLSHKD